MSALNENQKLIQMDSKFVVIQRTGSLSLIICSFIMERNLTLYH